MKWIHIIIQIITNLIIEAVAYNYNCVDTNQGCRIELEGDKSCNYELDGTPI